VGSGSGEVQPVFAILLSGQSKGCRLPGRNPAILPLTFLLIANSLTTSTCAYAQSRFADWATNIYASHRGEGRHALLELSPSRLVVAGKAWFSFSS